MPAGVSTTDLVKKTFAEWSEDKAPKLAAALAYYTVISLAPLLVFTVKIVGYVYRDDPAHKIEEQVGALTGGVGKDMIAQIIEKASEPGAGIIATIISAIILLFGASGVFGELQDSLNTIWEVRPKPDRGWRETVRDRFFSMGMVVGIAFLFLLSLVVSVAIGAISGGLMERTIGAESVVGKVVTYTLDLLISTGVVFVLFSAMFKVLPDVELGWKDVFFGAGVTAVLFQIGKYALTAYFHFSDPGSAYGAVGSVIALLVWVYYSAQIFFFGAELTQAYVTATGHDVKPSPNAERLTPAAPQSDKFGGPQGTAAQQAVPAQDAHDQSKQVGGSRGGTGGRQPASRREGTGVRGPRAPSYAAAPAFARDNPRSATAVYSEDDPANAANPEARRQALIGGGGLVAGLAVGAVAAYKLLNSPRKPGKAQSAAVQLDQRLDNLEQRVLRVRQAFHDVKHVPPSEQPRTWQRGVRDFVWKHPGLWPAARWMHLERLRAPR
ncbi:MAG TPA: YhjD/YihY/BrkB family envelope integrity protein [Tepidisphaeraceae bacterium]|nr:YhjD/YihY/BrkB family envelope integrity protein [Tepidisphaeraceae bacterium]